MPIKIIIPTTLKQQTNNKDEIELNAGTVDDALRQLTTIYPNLKRYLYSDGEKLRNFINIYLNEEDIRYLNGEQTILNDGDTLMIIPSVAGGASTTQAGKLPILNSGEISRYGRHIIMPEVGMEGQRRLKASTALIVGAGGLGTPAATYLVAAGVGRLGIVDFDTIEKSNLHRQFLYSEQDLGRSKAEVAKERLQRVNPNVNIELYKVKLDSSNALEILKDYDLIVDGTDNFPTRYLVNDACVLLGKPYVYASIFRFEGQASVFYAKEGPCYRCLYPEPPPPGLVPSCAEGGVLGVLPGIMGSIQAAQAITMLLGRGDPLIGRLLLFNALDMKFKEVKLKKNPDCPVCGSSPTVKKLIDYEAFCGITEEMNPKLEITVQTLKQWQDQKKDILTLDVREPFEYEMCHLQGSKLIPIGKLPERVNELNTADQIVVYCHTGVRSAQAVKFLNDLGFKKVKNLRGGIKAWAEEIDPTVQTY